MKKRKFKAAPRNFLESALPQTRKDQFFFIIKNQYRTLLKGGLWLALCLLPIVLVVYFQNRFEIGFYQKYIAGGLSKEDYHASMNVLMIYGTLLETLFTFVGAIAVAGLNRIMKSLLIGEGVLFFEDFKEGIKQNYWNTALLFFFFALLLSLCRFVGTFFIEYYLGIPFYVLLVILVLPIFTIASIFSSVYECNVFQAIWNATKLYFPYWWKYLLLSLFFFLSIYGLSLLETMPTLLAAIQLVLIVFVLPLYILLLYSVSFSLFDKYVNPVHFPSFCYAGLYKPEEKERELLRKKEK